MGKPTATEDALRALAVGPVSVQALCPTGTTVDAIWGNSSQFCEAVLTVGKVKLKIGPRSTAQNLARKICHRNGMCLPRTKGGKSFLQGLAAQVLADALAAIGRTPASEIVAKFQAGVRKRESKERKERRRRAEEEMRSAMRTWDFTLEEVTQMWYEREVDAVHET